MLNVRVPDFAGGLARRGRLAAIEALNASLVRALVLTLALSGLAACAKRYDARGVVVRVAPSAREVTISHEAIAGYMDAMVMPFDVDAPAHGLLAEVGVGDRVAFRLRVARNRSWIDRLRILSAPRPDAGLRESPARPRLAPVGAVVPDFALTDHHARRLTLASLRGQVVVVTFIYSRCPLPDYCPLMIANLKAIARRFDAQLGRDLALVAITFDPKFDTPDVLARYAQGQGADGPGWHFLTGDVADVGRVCDAFGIEFWPEDGLITHSLQTAVLDRDGRLAGTIEGKDYSPSQLGDLIATVLAD